MGSIEIGEAEGADQALLLHRLHFMQGIEPGRVFEGPPVELQKVDLVDAKAGKPVLHTTAHHIARHRTRLRAPFGEGHRSLVASSITLQEMAGDDLCRSVMIGHVEAVEPCIRVSLKRISPLLRIDRRTILFDIGNLPEAANEAADRQVRGEIDAFGMLGHGDHSSMVRIVCCGSGARAGSPRRTGRADAAGA